MYERTSERTQVVTMIVTMTVVAVNDPSMLDIAG